MKIIAFYLPQFHTFPENDEWWGKGFTEWTNTKKAKPLFKGHYQPHIPYHQDYYDLTNEDVMRRQIEDANRYGVYGFCFYHYWFKNGKMLMEKPVERFLENKSLNTHFCISWANEPWTRRWDGGSKKVLMPQEYGEKEDWEKHFDYLLQFFKDDRYIKVNGKPLLLLYRPDMINCLKPMLETWRALAEKNGYPGLIIMAQGSSYCRKIYDTVREESMDAYLMYEPGYTYCALALKGRNLVKNILLYKQFFVHYFPRKIISMLSRDYIKINKALDVCDYDVLWKAILKNEMPADFYPGGFTNWDNSPRRGVDGRIVTGSTPEKFETYMEKLITKAQHSGKDLLFINAWNEWAEGAHLEADEKHGYKYLEALREALLKTDEWE